MAEQIIQITEGTGKKLHGFDRTIGANLVVDEVVLLGEPYLASYTVLANAISGATGAAHVLQIMAGASLKVRIRKIHVSLQAATAAGFLKIGAKRLTTAGTGGTVVVPDPVDPADAASGATAMTLPTVAGTLSGGYFWIPTFNTAAAAPQAGLEEVWTQQPNAKPITIPAGVANGLAF